MKRESEPDFDQVPKKTRQLHDENVSKDNVDGNLVKDVFEGVTKDTTDADSSTASKVMPENDSKAVAEDISEAVRDSVCSETVAEDISEAISDSVCSETVAEGISEAASDSVCSETVPDDRTAAVSISVPENKEKGLTAPDIASNNVLENSERICEEVLDGVSNIVSENSSENISETGKNDRSEDEVEDEDLAEVPQDDPEFVSDEDIILDNGNLLSYCIPNNFWDLLKPLTEDQLKFALHILNQLITVQAPDHVPFRFFLSGSPGTGKSYLLNTLVKLVNSFFPENSEEVSLVLIMAPTEETASVINGTTIHNALAIPQTLQASDELPVLSANVAEFLYSKLKSIKLIIIDEISSVGKCMISYVNSRLKQIFGVSSDFANLPVILAGDLRLVPPKSDSPIYKNTRIWHNFLFYELETNLRQRGDPEFFRILTNFGEGRLTEADLELLNTRNFIFAPDLICPCVRTIYVFCDKESVDWFNDYTMMKLDGKNFISAAKDSLKGDVSAENLIPIQEYHRRKPLQDVDGLLQYLVLKIGVKYMISHSIDSVLRKGVMGYARELGNKLVCLVVEDFDHCDHSVGPPIKKVFIEKMDVTLRNNFIHNLSVTRNQFPLVPAEGVHVDDLRGKSVYCICISLLENKKMTGNLLYAALSRAKNLESLNLVGCVTESHSIRDEVLAQEMARLRDYAVSLSKGIMCPSNDFKVCYQDLNFFLNTGIRVTEKEAQKKFVTRYVKSSLLQKHDVMIFSGNISEIAKVAILKRCHDFGLIHPFHAEKEGLTFLLFSKLPHIILKKILRVDRRAVCCLNLLRIHHLSILCGDFAKRLNNSYKSKALRHILSGLPSKSPLIIIGGFPPGIQDMAPIKRFEELKLVKAGTCKTGKAVSAFTNLQQNRAEIHQSVLPYSLSPICVQVSRLLTETEPEP